MCSGRSQTGSSARVLPESSGTRMLRLTLAPQRPLQRLTPYQQNQTPLLLPLHLLHLPRNLCLLRHAALITWTFVAFPERPRRRLHSFRKSQVSSLPTGSASSSMYAVIAPTTVIVVPRLKSNLLTSSRRTSNQSMVVGLGPAMAAMGKCAKTSG